MTFSPITLKLRDSWTGFQPILKPIREHLDLISSTTSTIANFVFLSGKLFAQIPATLTRSAFVVMNSIGLLYMDWQVSFTLKTTKDSVMSLKMDVWQLVALTVAATVSGISDLLLMLAGVGASVASWAGRQSISSSIYTVTRPWGVTFLFVAAALDIGNRLLHYSLKGRLTQLMHDEKAKDRCEAILNTLISKPADIDPKDRFLVAAIRIAMDKYTLETLLTRLTSRKRCDAHLLMKQVKDNIEVQSAFTWNNLCLRILGYPALYLCKAYPDTLVHAATLCTTSILHTVNNAWKKWQESFQRSDIKQL